MGRIIKAVKDIIFKNDANGVIGKINERGWNPRGTHYRLEEWFKQRPALNAVFAPAMTGNDAADAAEIVALNIANKDFEVLGTNMTTALCTFAEGGGITLTTAGADADQAIVTPHLDTNQTAWAVAGTWGSENSVRFATWIKTGSAITKTVIGAGLGLTVDGVVNAAITSDDDKLAFRYSSDANDGKLAVISSRAGVDITTDLGIVVAVSTLYFLELEIDANRNAKAWVNGIEYPLGTGAAPLVTAKDYIPYVGIQANGTAPGAKAMNLLYMGMGRLAS